VSKETNRIDRLVADLASVRDDELVDEVRSLRATTLLATILDTPVDAWDLAVARPALATGSSSRWARRGRTGRRRLQLIALAAALALAAVLSIPALGVGRDIASFFAGWHEPDAPVPTAPDIVIASGEAGLRWRLVATRSDQGLCLGLLYRVGGEEGGRASCGYSDIRGDLPSDLRGDPATKCLATPTALVPCGSLPRHWIGPVGAGDGGSAGLNRSFAFGPLAEEVASVELLLTDGRAVRAHVVERPEGLDASLNFYWAAWSCGSSSCVDAVGPLVKMAIARDSAGRVLERRMPSWNGNPTGDPDGPPPPR
jgi:hypothetical protein